MFQDRMLQHVAVGGSSFAQASAAIVVIPPVADYGGRKAGSKAERRRDGTRGARDLTMT